MANLRILVTLSALLVCVATALYTIALAASQWIVGGAPLQYGFGLWMQYFNGFSHAVSPIGSQVGLLWAVRGCLIAVRRRPAQWSH